MCLTAWLCSKELLHLLCWVSSLTFGQHQACVTLSTVPACWGAHQLLTQYHKQCARHVGRRRTAHQTAAEETSIRIVQVASSKCSSVLVLRSSPELRLPGLIIKWVVRPTDNGHSGPRLTSCHATPSGCALMTNLMSCLMVLKSGQLRSGQHCQK